MAREGYIIKTTREKFTLKRSWQVNAFRVVDAQGNDIMQPWMDSAAQARTTAAELDIIIIDGDPPCRA